MSDAGSKIGASTSGDRRAMCHSPGITSGYRVGELAGHGDHRDRPERILLRGQFTRNYTATGVISEGMYTGRVPVD